MKPQCETSADCLRELARVMDQFGIDDTLTAINSRYVKYAKLGGFLDVPSFGCAKKWQFAIAEVEGKPVFIGDELYHVGYGKQTINEVVVLIPKNWSWNPPKPKTVMVEMLVEDARYVANTGAISLPMVAACKKALENLK